MEHRNPINEAIIRAMTDDELFNAMSMIKEELAYRQTDFLTIENFNGGLR